MQVCMADLIVESGVGFGTSGARGLVVKMTDKVCYAYTKAFLGYCEASFDCEHTLAIAGDLRPSTGRILGAVGKAATDAGWQLVYAGRIPSPAIALYGLSRRLPTVMVTGSHIPDDRNGIKFNHHLGEITKADERGIVSQVFDLDPNLFDETGALKEGPFELPAVDFKAEEAYFKRYVDFFGSGALAGLKVGVYEHSAVGRGILVQVLDALGASVVPLARSEKFIPVDTEAIRAEDIALAKLWAAQGFDAIASTDGDSDRPLLASEKGEWLRGDVLGILTAKALGISRIATPVSCNTALEKCGAFEKVRRTKIGSPYVIEGMEALVEAGKTVAGYEANGGFLLESDLELGGKKLRALPTRDALLPILGVLRQVKATGRKISELLAELPQRYSASGRLKEFPTDLSRKKLEEIRAGNLGEELFGGLSGKLEGVDETDGYRMTFSSGEIIHLRPSGNAPEFRCYVETAFPERSAELLESCLRIMEFWRA